MNNGKVRIYELSKELNLDNRDILVVCEQLNIAAKSHSSTITENEAERIRSAAEKYSPSHSSPHKPAPAAHGSTPSKESGAQLSAKKPQILEVRRHKSSSMPNQPNPRPVSTDDTASKAPTPPTAPQSSSVPSVQSPARPTIPSRPQRPVSPSATASPADAPEDQAPSPTVEESRELVVPEQLVQEPTPLVSAEEAPEIKPTAPAPAPAKISEISRSAERPQLVGPPSRPASPSPTSQPGTSSRPILKKAKGENPEGPSQSGTRAPERKPVQQRQPERGSDAPDRPQRASVSSDGGSDRPTSASVPELRRPKPVRPTVLRETSTAVGGPTRSRSTEGSEEAGTSAIPVEALETDEMKLRRPTPPKAVKRGKGWEEEEEEIQETAQKPGKAGAKGKRRPQLVVDEDEIELDIELEDEDDLEDEDGTDGPSAAQVSLSLARPAKPKGRPSQAKPTAATAAPTPKSRKGTSSRDRRDRREQEAKQEKPEKITLTTSLTVQELASFLVVPETDIIKALFYKGIAANINQTLDIPTASMIAQEMGIEVEIAEKEAEARKVTEMLDAADLESLQRRPPVVTIMGHVDHGKTTLLDSIRKTKVAQGEAGGITQHIGAYHVDVEHGDNVQQVVFLDTPGHEAFTAMRARGARVTDIAILVVAADDGVRPQTIEAISHAKAAGVPIVVAINKIDKEGAQPDRVKNELMTYDLVPEEFGGDTIMVPVSAMRGENLDTLLEMILLVAEVEDLYANPDRPAKGTVIEAHLDKARGPVATLIVQNGTLRVGDTLVAGSVLGKVRAMMDDRGNRVEAAAPSFAVEVLGLGDVPAAGDEFDVFQDEREARTIASARVDQQRQSRLQQQAMAARRITLNTLSAQAQEGELKELNLILKADVQGSVEAILGALQQLPQNEVQIRILLTAPGEVTETDVDLAAASGAVILGFNTTLASGARQAADAAGVDVREYNIIYKLLDDIQGAMEGLLEPEMVEEPLGQVEVRAVFPVGRGSVAGCYVLSGKVIRNCNVRVRRGNEIVHSGVLDSLKRMKEDAKEVNAGYECGVGIDNFNGWAEGDIIEAFRLVTKRRSLSPA